MRSVEERKFIEDHDCRFWYTPAPKGENVTDELLVETILNYGSWEDVQELFNVMGLKNVATVFGGMIGRKKLNYFPEIHNYFNLYFKKICILKF